MYAYDTDRPHTHPWEMLGFSVKPSWWETQYGPGPYTRNNLPLWQDLSAGIVRQPNFKVDKKYLAFFNIKKLTFSKFPTKLHGRKI